MRRTLVLMLAIALPTTVATQSTTTRAEFERWKTELSNWGRWGNDDQIGALNLITPAKRRQAAALVREGFSVSLSRDADTVKAIDNPDPFEHSMLTTGTDRMGVVPHGVAHTHLDSGAHQLRRRLLQRLQTRQRRGDEERPHAQLDHQREERHLHAR